ncbi:MAG TPA: signal peptide peptidase SppA [Anaerolineales bacterium]|nr:signal peptide peptidase SppA [Anaerolineales bacterium]
MLLPAEAGPPPPSPRISAGLLSGTLDTVGCFGYPPTEDPFVSVTREEPPCNRKSSDFWRSDGSFHRRAGGKLFGEGLMHGIGVLGWLIGNLLGWMRNLLASLRRRGLEYVLVRLEGSYPERRDRRPVLPFPLSRLSLFPSEPSLEELREVFERLAGDRRVRGVLLRVGHLTAGPATVQALRGMVENLQGRGKRVVCWLPQVDTWTAYLASACDRVILPESGTVFAAGLRAEVTFLKETLGLLGVEADFEAFCEYKVGPDRFRRDSMSGPHREMLEAILDADFEELVRGIARGRGLASEQVRALVDRMPLSAREAVEEGLIDEVRYEDELIEALDPEVPSASLRTWREARPWLVRPIRWRRRPTVGVVSVEGMLIVGRSRRLPPLPAPLPFPQQLAGSETVVQALRAAGRDRGMAAVILYVDSPGGSALASDLIWREVRCLRGRKPVVVLMGNRAASGGYYLSAAANYIVAQPLTLTGSIGVWGGKFVMASLYERLRVGREALQRGARAGLYAEDAPFNDDERQAVRKLLETVYEQFKERVAEGRGMGPEQVEEIARGRVWTGRQALERGLVDELGGVETALRQAKALAGLDPDVWMPVMPVAAPRSFLLPSAPSAPAEVMQAVAEVLRALNRERVWAMPPWMVHIRG